MKPGVDYIGIGFGVALFNDRGEVLLIRRGEKAKNEPLTWALPGGAVDFGETIDTAAAREMREELGINIAVNGHSPAYDHLLPDTRQHWITMVVYAKLEGGTPTIMEPEKCAEIGWFSVDTLPSPASEMLKPAITYLKNYQPR